MPDISATIRQLMLDDANVSGLVGTRIRSDVISQRETLPAIAYMVIDTLPNETLVGIADVSKARIQIDCIALSRQQANLLGDHVRIALEKKHRGDNAGQFINEINLQTGEVHGIYRNDDGSDQRRFVTSLDFFVSYRVTTS